MTREQRIERIVWAVARAVSFHFPQGAVYGDGDLVLYEGEPLPLAEVVDKALGFLDDEALVTRMQNLGVLSRDEVTS